MVHPWHSPMEYLPDISSFMYVEHTHEHNSKYHKTLKQEAKMSKMEIIRILSSVKTVFCCSSSFEISFVLVSISSNSLSPCWLSKAAILKKNEARNFGKKENDLSLPRPMTTVAWVNRSNGTK